MRFLIYWLHDLDQLTDSSPKNEDKDAWLAQLVENVTLDRGVMSLSSMLAVELT